METTQRIFPVLPAYERLDFDELLQRLDAASPQVRASALAALGGSLEKGLAPIVDAIKDEHNRRMPWFGFITVSWVGIVVLLDTGDKHAQKIAQELVSTWSIDERQHLASWLKDFPTYAEALAP